MLWRVFSIALPVLGAFGVLLWRLRETRRPLTVRRIVIPPLAMSTGLAMFFYPPAQIPWLWAWLAFLSGATLFALPLIRTSRLEPLEGQVYLKRSRAFLWVLAGLLLVRLLLREEISHYLSPLQTGSVFFLLAFGMVVHWRVDMYHRFRKLRESAP